MKTVVLKARAYWGKGTDDDGFPVPFHLYLIFEHEVDLRNPARVAVVWAVSASSPLPDKQGFLDQTGTEGRAAGLASAELDVIAALAGLNHREYEVEPSLIQKGLTQGFPSIGAPTEPRSSKAPNVTETMPPPGPEWPGEDRGSGGSK